MGGTFNHFLPYSLRQGVALDLGLIINSADHLASELQGSACLVSTCLPPLPTRAGIMDAGFYKDPRGTCPRVLRHAQPILEQLSYPCYDDVKSITKMSLDELTYAYTSCAHTGTSKKCSH